MSMDVLEGERMDRDAYIKKLNEDRQKRMVAFKSTSSLTSSVLTWSHRLTNCDVISTITTTTQMKNGEMKDIMMYNTNKKFKTPSKKSAINMYQNPLENGIGDPDKARKMCCDILQKEKKAFMSQLHSTRAKRVGLENIAAVIIQTIYRGYFVRCHLEEIKDRNKMREAVYNRLKAHLNKKHLPPIPTLGEHRRRYAASRASAATIIQCSFRSFLSRNYCSRRRFEYETERVHDSAVRIQNMTRRKIAISSVERRRERTTLQKRAQGALKIQCQIRMLLSRRRVANRRFKLHWLAARMIQGCFRGRNTRRCMAVYLAAREKVKFFRGARGVQQVVRARIARSRVNRIKLRYLYLKAFRAAAAIQSLVRSFLAKARVKRCIDDKRQKAQIEADLLAAESKRDSANEAEELAKSMDIFYQTKLGATSNVDALYHSEIESGASPESLRETVNDIGDTILSQAARENHLDIVRKCINWGFDINHENAVGESIVFLAANAGHMSLVNYLLSDAARNVATLKEEIAKKKKEAAKSKKNVPPKKEPKQEDKEEDNTGDDNTFITDQYESERPDEVNTGGDEEQHVDESVDQKEDSAQEDILINEDEGLRNLSAKVLKLSKEDKGTIMCAAAKCNDTSFLKMIVEHKYIDDIDERQPLTDMTALHVACAEGAEDRVQFLLKHGAKLSAKDDNGQLPLHKAASSSLEVMKLLLGISEQGGGKSLAMEVAEEECRTIRTEQLLRKDTDGKDCFLIASLSGRNEIVDFISSYLDMSQRTISDEVGWSENDTVSVLKLVENGNLSCLRNVVAEGFDLSWTPEETGMTAAMVACKLGHTDIIEYLVSEVGADFSATDVNGMNSLHYGAHHQRRDILPLLLSYGDKAKKSCLLSSELLIVQDSKGYTPIHYCAEFGSSLSFDLLAQEHFDAAITKRDSDGCTPLLVACKFKQSKKIIELLSGGADAKVVDSSGHTCLWHYFIEVSPEPECSVRMNQSLELQVVQKLLSDGCPLFSVSPEEREVDKIAEAFHAFVDKSKSSSRQEKSSFEYILEHIQPTDLAAFECNLSFFNMLPKYCTPLDSWGVTLSSMFFFGRKITDVKSLHQGSKCLASLFDGNIVAVLLDYKYQACCDDPIKSLQTVLFKGLSILGWAISSQNEAALTFLLRKDMSPNASVDLHGNNCLHWAALYGTKEMVCALLDSTTAASSEVMIIEKENNDGFSASMLGAKHGAFENTKQIIQLGSSARKALEGKYWAWILAIAIENEKREINSQTGVYGDDDQMYFPLHPEHNLIYS